jgi:hypothetical protein
VVGIGAGRTLAIAEIPAARSNGSIRIGRVVGEVDRQSLRGKREIG